MNPRKFVSEPFEKTIERMKKIIAPAYSSGLTRGEPLG
jgi:hypothetical protein